jgi:hypothetical protein
VKPDRFSAPVGPAASIVCSYFWRRLWGPRTISNISSCSLTIDHCGSRKCGTVCFLYVKKVNSSVLFCAVAFIRASFMHPPTNLTTRILKNDGSSVWLNTFSSCLQCIVLISVQSCDVLTGLALLTEMKLAQNFHQTIQAKPHL